MALPTIGSAAASIYSGAKRSSRKTYLRELGIWISSGLLLECIFQAAVLIQEAVDEARRYDACVDYAANAASYAWLLALFFIAVRRCRDCALSASYAFILLIPGVNVMLLLALAILPGRPDPKLKALLEDSQRLRTKH